MKCCCKEAGLLFHSPNCGKGLVGSLDPNFSEVAASVKRYVVGLMFDSNNPELVALIRKNRPKWQAGRLNGIGGHIEPYDDTPEAAMSREFTEETGYSSESWLRFAVMTNPVWEVYCFSNTGDLRELRTETDETVEIHRIDQLSIRSDVISNIPVLVSMARSPEHKRFGRPMFYIEYPISEP